MVVNRVSSTATNHGMAAPGRGLNLASRQRAETYATTKPILNARTPLSFWVGETVRPGGIAAACSQGGSWPGRSFGSPNSSEQDIGNSPYPSISEAFDATSRNACDRSGSVWTAPRLGENRLKIGRTSYENVIKLRRALGCCHPVNCIAVPERSGSVANHIRHPASQRHGRSTETSGKAATGGKVTRVRSGGTPRPDIAIHSNGERDAVVCAGFGHVEACPARERGQQLQRWLRIKLETRQGPLGWMQRIGGVLLGFLSNLQRHTHLQELRRMRGNQNVPGLGPTTSLVVLQRHAGWGEISRHRSQSMEVAHAYRGSIAES